MMNDLNSLVESVNDDDSGTSEPTAAPREPLSKSKRIRLYMEQHPGVRNKDVVAALSHHGVKAADVANVKSQLKKKQSKPPKKSASTKPRAKPAAADADSSDPTDAMIDAKIGLDVLEAGMEFINKSGGMAEAQHVLNLIRRIRSL